jgi:hypothetical protein
MEEQPESLGGAGQPRYSALSTSIAVCPCFAVISTPTTSGTRAGRRRKESTSMVEEHEAAEKLKHLVVATENPVNFLGAADYREMDHPSYRHRAPRSAGVRRLLAGDPGEEV